MANWRKPSDRASETVTFRLRPDERHLLEHLAEIGGTGISDLLRFLIRSRAEELGIEGAPEPRPRRRPGRPPRARPRGEADLAGSPAGPASSPEPGPPAEPGSEASRPAPERRGAVSFADLVNQFIEHFGDRGEGTRRELAETVDFLTAPREGGPILPRETPLDELDSHCLAAARRRIADLDLRFSRKNLYLTYLRMMMHFAVKGEGPAPAVNPVLDLEPFTMRELGSWPTPRGAGEGDR